MCVFLLIVGVELEGGFGFFGVESVFVRLIEGGFGSGVERSGGLRVVGRVEGLLRFLGCV